MNTIKELLNLITVDAVFFGFVVLFALKEVITLFSWFCDTFGIQTKWTSRRKAEQEMLDSHEQRLGLISSDVKATKDKINVISQMLIEMQSKNDATERAKLKDRISQSYRYYHAKGEWNEMEKEAFDDLIEDYEAHGGTNSFVHEICLPESYTWTVLK